MTDIDCDYSVAAENDPCVVDANESCSADKKTMLTCKGNKYVQPTACSGPAGCAVTVTAKSSKVTCDTGAPPPQEDTKKGKHHHK